MDENELRELFKATNTAEPLSEGWPGLLRFGLAVAAAEREACAKLCDTERNEFMAKAGENNGRESDFAFGSVNSAERIKAAIMLRSNAALTGAEGVRVEGIVMQQTGD